MRACTTRCAPMTLCGCRLCSSFFMTNTAAFMITFPHQPRCRPTIFRKSTASIVSGFGCRQSWFQRGSIKESDNTLFDHTSILKYVIDKWAWRR
jgi:hypothetical protein